MRRLPEHDWILMDAHVHHRSCFDLVEILDSASANLTRIARSKQLSRPILGVVVVAHSVGDVPLERSAESCRAAARCDWQLQTAPDGLSIVCQKKRSVTLILLPGTQIETAEKLEVLGIGAPMSPNTGWTLAETIDRIHDAEGLTIVPWGFGKWWGHRGRALASLLQAGRPNQGFYLGDSGGRPRLSPRPKLLRNAVRFSLPVLSGSDPFPRQREVRRIGTFGTLVRVKLESDAPMHDLVRQLRTSQPTLEPFGKGLGWTQFLLNQTLAAVRRMRAPSRGESQGLV